ncbi:MAG: glycine-rich domain-containing protein [Luteibaculaceae bacterium]
MKKSHFYPFYPVCLRYTSKLFTVALFTWFYIPFSIGQVGNNVYEYTQGAITYRVHEYTSVGANTFDVPAGVSELDVLIVAGGGGGGTSTGFSSAGSGGGGAGGLIFRLNYAVTPSTTINITVGNGGAPGPVGQNSGINGQNSLFDGLVALGGGGGIGANGRGNNGGSGGGSRGNVTGGTGLQPTSTSGGSGNNGGTIGGSPTGAPASGGGGAGGAAETLAGLNGERGGNGGVGLELDITGALVFYAGGGGGGTSQTVTPVGTGGLGGGGNGGNNTIVPTAGAANSGGGGGCGNNNRQGAAGGSGIVIIRYVESSTLPIELLSFDAKPLHGQVELTWTTLSELNNAYFSLERSKDGVFYEVIEEIPGAGNSSSRIDYNTIDQNPLTGISYYRLKQTDFDGQYAYFNPVSVTIQNNAKYEIMLYPNPASKLLNLVSKAEEYTVDVQNNLGEIIFRAKNLKQLDLSNFPDGTYFIRATFPDNIPIVKKLIISK